MLSSYKSQYYV